MFHCLSQQRFNPTNAPGLRAWWNADFVTLVNSGINVGSIAPMAGSAKNDSTYLLANADSTFASVPYYETPDSGFAAKASWGTATDEVRFLETPSFATAISQPMTWFQVWYAFTATNSIYLRLNTSGSSTNSPALIADLSNDLDAGDTTTATSVPYVTGTTYVTCHVYSATTNQSAAYLNSRTASATGTTNGDTFTSLFTGTFPDGEPGSYRIRHILAYDGVLSAEMIGGVLLWLGQDAGVLIA